MILKRVARFFTPHGIVQRVDGRRFAAMRREQQKVWDAKLAMRERQVRDFMHGQGESRALPYSYQDSIDHLVSQGFDRTQVVEGSMPEESLDHVAKAIQMIPNSGPLNMLHIGNFVGISLSYLSHALVARNGNSVIVSIDPNLPHRGIQRPAEAVIRLLNRYGLQRNSVVLTGYSLAKSISNDGTIFDGQYDPFEQYNAEASCERQLDCLARLGATSFDVAVVDGNHETEYLRQEVAAVRRLLRPGGLLVIDDVCASWSNIQKVYTSLRNGDMKEVAADGRVGILQNYAEESEEALGAGSK
jgi:predicted O-methyltransferase YrrM